MQCKALLLASHRLFERKSIGMIHLYLEIKELIGGPILLLHRERQDY